MKTILRLILAAVILAVLSAAAPAKAQTRVATVDLKRVLDKYYKSQQVMTKLQEDKVAKEKELKEYLDENDKIKADYDKLQAAASDPSITSEEREKRKSTALSKLEELRSSEKSITTYRSTASEMLSLEDQRMGENILKEIRAVVDAKAKAGGFALVLDTTAIGVRMGAPIVLYSNGENDLTDAVLVQLNAASPDSTPPAAPASTPKAGDKAK